MTSTPLHAKILVVEDAEDIKELVANVLERDGFDVVRASNGMEAMERLGKEQPDLVVLDIMMPVISGLEVLQHIRQHGSTPVILLSALESEDSRVRGLQLGADDYLVKPFSVRELSARVSALLRRSGMSASAAPAIEYPGLRIDLTGREVWVKDELVETTAKEFDLLAYLAASPGRVFTRHQLLREVWQSSSEWQQEGTVTEHVRRIRHKIEEDAEKPKFLQTVRGVGYRFERRHLPRADDAPPA